MDLCLIIELWVKWRLCCLSEGGESLLFIKLFAGIFFLKFLVSALCSSTAARKC